MSISVGDKYVIEIGAVAELPEGKKKYFIKPFESLVFDRKGLKQLEKFDRLALKEYDLGYKKGYEDGKNEAIYNGELIPELKKQEYDRGFQNGRNFGYKIGFSKGMNQSATRIDLSADAYGIGVSYKEALDDVSDLMAFFNCEFMSECYPEEYKEDYSLYDLNAKYGLAEILEKWKAYTKQQKEVENYHKLVTTLRTVTDEYPRETIVSALSEFGIEVNESEEK